MNISIITLAFDPQQKGFNNEELQKFLAGKTILQIKPEFFMCRKMDVLCTAHQ